MNILPCHNNYNKSHQKFTANNRQVYNAATGKMYKTTTYFFRGDMNWNGFVNLLGNKYKNTSKVNICNDACSCGHEPVSLAIKLKEQFGKLSEKFFPIKASDYNQENIENAKSGIYGIKNEELYQLDTLTGGNYRNYLSFAPAKNEQDDIALMARMDIRKNIEFKQGDIFDNIENIPSSNTVLLCRNFWRYLPTTGNNAEKLAQKLGDKLDSSSLVVIGEYDIECGTKELLEKNGFSETDVKYVFQKDKITQ